MPTSFTAFEAAVRQLLAATPSMPATVIAERVGWTGSIIWFRDNVRLLRPQALMPELMQGFREHAIVADADRVCGASYAHRLGEGVSRRNGYRHRDLDTRVGTLDVAVPKLPECSYFPARLLQRRRRAEAAVTSVVATCYLLGVSTRRMAWCSHWA